MPTAAVVAFLAGRVYRLRTSTRWIRAADFLRSVGRCSRRPCRHGRRPPKTHGYGSGPLAQQPSLNAFLGILLQGLNAWAAPIPRVQAGVALACNGLYYLESLLRLRRELRMACFICT